MVYSHFPRNILVPTNKQTKNINVGGGRKNEYERISP